MVVSAVRGVDQKYSSQELVDSSLVAVSERPAKKRENKHMCFAMNHVLPATSLQDPFDRSLLSHDFSLRRLADTNLEQWTGPCSHLGGQWLVLFRKGGAGQGACCLGVTRRP